MVIKGLVDMTKYFDMGRLTWTIQVGPEWNHMGLCKRRAEGDMTTQRRCEDGAEKD